ncbi:hydroxyisourate hydrolase [Siculibacillus lacustris]|uniref:5-hydroxyisourate hydrolase n=1 Tax=Siculibacillus lacustris TaxID=1549641 RepID=A0A4Q9VQE4_9HYPH|nr:hydroxyisourate hydrolase [Siculibacillus lacustris]TBW37187.1 hydroxyisourate hydrolase [Siculibacillus lacustris]
MGRLTTHVLDTSTGRPAADVEVRLWSIAPTGERRHLATRHTNADGRIDGALLEGDALVAGTYELVFAAGAYFFLNGVDLPDPAFLDEIPLRFGIADPNLHYHVPLLVSPWAYSTYRGS